MKALTTLLVVGMFLATVAMADDVDDVKAAVRGYFAAHRARDVNAYMRYRMAEYSNFGPTGGLINRSTSLEQQRSNFQAAIDQGIRRNIDIRHLEVRVYGNSAIATGYVVGTVTNPDGSTDQVTWQRSGFWIKQGSQWKEAHHHRGAVSTPQ